MRKTDVILLKSRPCVHFNCGDFFASKTAISAVIVGNLVMI